mmetsp:Transcript_26000/g.39360  ORF Transcript_26000/g.39360 Transcript_26000/m.39360 type:complete len:117 (+) Transcript_26000:30-380(+)
MNCSTETSKRQKCHSLYGKLSEDCLIQELEEKRCLSFQICAQEARAYYGTPSTTKSVCASWAEAFCFGNPALIMEEHVLDQHLRASEQVNRDKRLKANCRKVAMDLAKCMQLKKNY